MEKIVGPLFIRDNTDDFGTPHETGWSLPMHAHPFAHVTIFHAGRYRYRLGDGDWIEATIPSAVNVPKNVEHALECLEGPGHCWCVFPREAHD